MTKIVIYITGGTMQSVMSDDPDVEVVLHDQDNIDAGDPEPDVPAEAVHEVWP